MQIESTAYQIKKKKKGKVEGIWIRSVFFLLTKHTF